MRRCSLSLPAIKRLSLSSPMRITASEPSAMADSMEMRILRNWLVDQTQELRGRGTSAP